MRRRRASSLGAWVGSVRRRGPALAFGLWCLTVGAVPFRAAEIAVPNGSFELPTTPFVSILIDAWQKTPKPDWYPEDEVYSWDQLTGIFKNPAPSNATHIANCDGDQALWLFAVPEVGLYQDLAAPALPADVVFEVGKSYHLTVGVIGGLQGMMEGVTLELALYYVDAATNRLTVAATAVTNTPAVFADKTRFTDFQVQVPMVRATDPWAGRVMGVRLLSTVRPDLQGWYWDLDNVRLASFRLPAFTEIAQSDGQIQFTLESEPGQRFALLSSTNLLLPLAQWETLGTLTNVTGRASLSVPMTNGPACFYQARLLE